MRVRGMTGCTDPRTFVEKNKNYPTEGIAPFYRVLIFFFAKKVGPGKEGATWQLYHIRHFSAGEKSIPQVTSIGFG
jgi:hypothetical protein